MQLKPMRRRQQQQQQMFGLHPQVSQEQTTPQLPRVKIANRRPVLISSLKSILLT
jgi:hypothetical protein